jgi:hypothetical protein
MTDDIENRLRRALRPVDAPEGFAQRLMSRLPARDKPVVVALPVKSRNRLREFGLPAALAASLLAAVLLGQQLASHRIESEQAAGRAAAQELLQALRVTSEKLDMAYEAVNNPPAQTGPAEDEENRS